MIITLKDGSTKEYSEPKSIIEIAADISEGLARMACAGEVNGEVEDLRTVIDKDCNLSILTFNDEGGKAAFRHTTSHIMAQAIKRLYPDTKLAIGPSIADGFYYDVDRETPLTSEDLEKIEAEMKKIVKEDLKLERFELPRAEAIAFMKEKEEPYKVELIEDLPEDAVISFYRQGEFTDLCAGPHLMSTKPVKAFKLTSLAGAYWRGSEKNKMLQRIYVSCFSVDFTPVIHQCIFQIHSFWKEERESRAVLTHHKQTELFSEFSVVTTKKTCIPPSSTMKIMQSNR